MADQYVLMIMPKENDIVLGVVGPFSSRRMALRAGEHQVDLGLHKYEVMQMWKPRAFASDATPYVEKEDSK